MMSTNWVTMTSQKIHIYARKLLPTVNWGNQTRKFHMKYFLEDNAVNLITYRIYSNSSRGDFYFEAYFPQIFCQFLRK